MAFTYRNVVQRPLSYAEHDENLQTVEQLHDGAVAARDAAILASGIYANTTAGLAATSSGEYFSIPSTDVDGFLDLYLNNAGVADFVKQYPSTNSLGTAAAENIGTSGNAVPKLNAANTWSDEQTFGYSSAGGSSRTRLSLNNTETGAGLTFAINSSGHADSSWGGADTAQGAVLRTNASASGGLHFYVGNLSAEFAVWTNQLKRIAVLANGNVGIGTDSPSAKLDVNSDTVRLRTARTPASATASGNAGDICWDSSYLYICVATNTWRRVAHASW